MKSGERKKTLDAERSLTRRQFNANLFPPLKHSTNKMTVGFTFNLYDLS